MIFNPVDSRWLYNVVDTSLRFMKPLSDQYLTTSRQLTRLSDLMNLPGNVPYLPEEFFDNFRHLRTFLRTMAGTLYVQHMLINTYHKPEFGIEDVKIKDNYYEINERKIIKKSFCNLLHFKKMGGKEFNQPKMLLVAPMSGHYATLLRDTVADMLPYYDVYITDWKNARDVPLTEGAFDFDEFADYLISFMHILGPDLNVMAVCQPTVPLLVALAMMSEDNDPHLPSSVILLGGPIDTENSPTSVNELATSRSDNWFEQNVISIVPSRYKGYMRLVYPGFMQLSGFMSMNLQRHMESLGDAIQNYANDKVENAFKTVKFYTEYFSTMDLTAEFYMQTIDAVFQRKLLAKGQLKTKGRYINLRHINKPAILAIEGERDDITGIGQTKSVIELCTGLPDSMKRYILAEGVGHYGLFNGSKFRNIILPEIRKFTDAHEEKRH